MSNDYSHSGIVHSGPCRILYGRVIEHLFDFGVLRTQKFLCYDYEENSRGLDLTMPNPSTRMIL
jgi:hypothetical protein